MPNVLDSISGMINPMNAVSGGLQTGMGAVQMISGGIAQRKANKLFSQIPQEDYRQSIILQQLQDRMRAMDMGSDALTVANRGLLREGMMSGYNTLRRGTGGDVGALLTGISSVNRAYGRNVAQLAAQQAAARENLSQRLEGLTGQMAQRKLSLQQQAYMQKLAEAKQRQTYGQQNIMGGLETVLNDKNSNTKTNDSD